MNKIKLLNLLLFHLVVVKTVASVDRSKRFLLSSPPEVNGKLWFLPERNLDSRRQPYDLFGNENRLQNTNQTDHIYPAGTGKYEKYGKYGEFGDYDKGFTYVILNYESPSPPIACNDYLTVKKQLCDKMSGYDVKDTIVKTNFTICDHQLTDVNLVMKNETSILARFGRGDQGDFWTYYNEITKNVEIEILSPQDVSNVKDLINLTRITRVAKGMPVKVESDVLFAAQSIESKNPTRLEVLEIIESNAWRRGIDVARELELCFDMNQTTELTRLSLTPDKMKIKCFGSPKGNSCGKCGLPANNQETNPVLLKKVWLQPQGKGAATPDGQWRRNQYLFRGSFYFVYINLFDCY